MFVCVSHIDCQVDCVSNYHVSALTDQDRLTLLYQVGWLAGFSDHGFTDSSPSFSPECVIKVLASTWLRLLTFLSR